MLLVGERKFTLAQVFESKFRGGNTEMTGDGEVTGPSKVLVTDRSPRDTRLASKQPTFVVLFTEV
jgi:hypothetical protein